MDKSSKTEKRIEEIEKRLSKLEAKFIETEKEDLLMEALFRKAKEMDLKKITVVGLQKKLLIDYWRAEKIYKRLAERNENI